MKLRAIPPIVAGMIFATYASTSCLADIHVLKCSFDDDEWMYFTRYTDGTPARIGKAIGVGDKALAFQDRFGALVFIETNADGTPLHLLPSSAP